MGGLILAALEPGEPHQRSPREVEAVLSLVEGVLVRLAGKNDEFDYENLDYMIVIGEDGALVEGGDLMCPFPIVPGGAPIDIPQKEFIAAQADLRTICLPAVLMKTNRESMPVEFYTHFIQCADAVFYAELAAACEAVIEVPAALCQYRRHEQTTTSHNRREPGAVIADEWQAMVTASALLEKSGFSAWLWNFRQRCLLAGTSRRMLQGVEELTPHYREEVVRSTREITGLGAWWLGNLAVALRDFLRQGRRRGW